MEMMMSIFSSKEEKFAINTNRAGFIFKVPKKHFGTVEPQLHPCFCAYNVFLRTSTIGRCSYSQHRRALVDNS
jgi:hypothetical protein